MQTTNSEEMSNANRWIYLPLFQLYWFLTSTSPLGLKGPFSENAPTPKEEQPGPANKKPDIQNPNRPNVSLRCKEKKKVTLVREKWGPPFSQRTSGLEAGSTSASAK